MASDVTQDAAPITSENETTNAEVAVVEDDLNTAPGTEVERSEALSVSAPVEELPIDAWSEGDKDWPHEFVEFRGDRLAVRKPSPQALGAFSLASGKFVPTETQNNMTSMFIQRHLSEATYDRIMNRLMDPDDVEYGASSIGELMSKIVRLHTSPDSVT